MTKVWALKSGAYQREKARKTEPSSFFSASRRCNSETHDWR